MQEDHDVLLIRGAVLGGSHDQGRGQQVCSCSVWACIQWVPPWPTGKYSSAARPP